MFYGHCRGRGGVPYLYHDFDLAKLYQIALFGAAMIVQLDHLGSIFYLGHYIHDNGSE